jgi:hypothetical protein
MKPGLLTAADADRVAARRRRWLIESRIWSA